jgi:hypothetical protein
MFYVRCSENREIKTIDKKRNINMGHKEVSSMTGTDLLSFFLLFECQFCQVFLWNKLLFWKEFSQEN